MTTAKIYCATFLASLANDCAISPFYIRSERKKYFVVEAKIFT